MQDRRTTPLEQQHKPLAPSPIEGPGNGVPSGDLADVTFDEWLTLGVALGYCTNQYCETHDGSPLHETEEIAWEAGWDPCIHVVRLGTPGDWELDISDILTETGDG